MHTAYVMSGINTKIRDTSKTRIKPVTQSANIKRNMIQKNPGQRTNNNEYIAMLHKIKVNTPGEKMKTFSAEKQIKKETNRKKTELKNRMFEKTNSLNGHSRRELMEEKLCLSPQPQTRKDFPS